MTTVRYKITELQTCYRGSTCQHVSRFRIVSETNSYTTRSTIMVNTVVTRTFPEMRLVQMFVTSSTSLLRHLWNSPGDFALTWGRFPIIFSIGKSRIHHSTAVEFKLLRIRYCNFASTKFAFFAKLLKSNLKI